MKREIGRALRRELRGIHVDEDLKRRILNAAVQSPPKRQVGYGLRALGFAAALALMVGTMAFILSMQSVKPDVRHSTVLSQGEGERSSADIASRVWRNPEDIYYHLKSDCPSYVGGGELISLTQAVEEGKQPCPKCVQQNEEATEIPAEPVAEANSSMNESVGIGTMANLRIKAEDYETRSGGLLMVMKDYDYEFSVSESSENADTSWCDFTQLDSLVNELSSEDFMRWEEAWSQNPEMISSQSLVEMQAQIFATNEMAIEAEVNQEAVIGYSFDDLSKPEKKYVLYELPAPYMNEVLPLKLQVRRKYWQYDGVDVFEWWQDLNCRIEEIELGSYNLELGSESHIAVDPETNEAVEFEADPTVNVAVGQGGIADIAWLNMGADDKNVGLWVCRMESGYAFILFIDPWDDMGTASLELVSKEGKAFVPTGVLNKESLPDAIGAIYLERMDLEDAYELIILIEGSDPIYLSMDEINVALEVGGFAEAYVG